MEIANLRWPDDKSKIAGLNLDEKQWWFIAQDSQEMTIIGNTTDFTRFWFWCYLMPLKVKRFIYKFKIW